MHPDLSPHLHTDECNKIINELQACHAENKFSRFIGVCNKIDSRMVKCLHEERVRRSAANRAKALEKQQLIRERMQQPGNPVI